MKQSVENRVIIIKRTTRLDELISRFNTLGQAKFYVEHLGTKFDDYEDEHKKYYESLDIVKSTTSSVAKIQLIDRHFLPNFIFAKSDIIVVVGQDGLVANSLKYLNGQSLIGVNPDRARWDGVLLPFDPGNVSGIISEVAANKREIKLVTMGKIRLQNGQEQLAVNDFFIGQKTHTSARYSIKYQDKVEQQSSSGIIVSTGLGSSGWMRSVITGASGIASVVSKNHIKVKTKTENAWANDWLTFSVREPFPSNRTGTSIVFGTIPAGTELTVVSSMSENGVIFSDGIEKDYIEFNSGMEAKITVAKIKGNIVV